MSRSCKYCLQGSLQWKQIDGKWRLFDESGRKHKCSVLRQVHIQMSKLIKAYS